MEGDLNPYRSPAQTVTMPSSAGDVRTRLELAIDRYSNAIIARRWAATVLDTAVIIFFFMAVHVALGDALHRRLLPFTLLLIALYYPVLEGLCGATIGKLAVGIKVVNYEGQRPGIPKALVRTFLRLVEVNPLLLGGIPAGVIAMMSRRKQRLGDMIARTLVVYRNDV
ncbi:MAG TPA: RDD family protein [Pirellulales bacterium]|nr:RDD family protein [Pirellulales bacterium]